MERDPGSTGAGVEFNVERGHVGLEGQTWRYELALAALVVVGVAQVANGELRASVTGKLRNLRRIPGSEARWIARFRLAAASEEVG